MLLSKPRTSTNHRRTKRTPRSSAVRNTYSPSGAPGTVGVSRHDTRATVRACAARLCGERRYDLDRGPGVRGDAGTVNAVEHHRDAWKSCAATIAACVARASGSSVAESPVRRFARHCASVIRRCRSHWSAGSVAVVPCTARRPPGRFATTRGVSSARALRGSGRIDARTAARAVNGRGEARSPQTNVIAPPNHARAVPRKPPDRRFATDDPDARATHAAIVARTISRRSR